MRCVCYERCHPNFQDSKPRAFPRRAALRSNNMSILEPLGIGRSFSLVPPVSVAVPLNTRGAFSRTIGSTASVGFRGSSLAALQTRPSLGSRTD